MSERTRQHRGKTYRISIAHPDAERFPWMEPDELDELVEDIRTNGQEEDCVRLPDGRLIDGRNRELACRIAGVEPRYRTANVSEADIPALVRSWNLHRRHLTPSQRAMLAAESANLPNCTQVDAARDFGVSTRSVGTAASVLKKSPILADAVKEGHLSVGVAARAADLPGEVQFQIATSPDPAETAAEALEELEAEEDHGDAWEPEDEESDEAPEPQDDTLPVPMNDASRTTLRPKGKPPKPLDKNHPFYDVLKKFTALNGAITKALRTDKGAALLDALREAQVGKHHLPFLHFTHGTIIGDECKPSEVKFVGLHALRSLILKVGARKQKIPAGWAAKAYQGALEVARNGGKPQ